MNNNYYNQNQVQFVNQGAENSNYYYQTPPIDPYEEEKRLKKRNALKKTRNDYNKLGAYLLISLGVSNILVAILMIIYGVVSAISGNSDFNSIIDSIYDDTFSFWSLNSIISILMFFIAGLFYIKIRRLSLNSLFVFNKIKFSKLICLVLVGLSVSVFANYVASIIDTIFTSLNLDAGGSVETEAMTIPDIAIYFISVALVPALVEEFAFRGIIMGSLRKYGDAVALFVSSAIFGAFHGNFIQIPFAFILGLAMGFIALYSNSLLPGIIVHFLNNGMSVFFDVLVQNSEVWNISMDTINIIHYAYTVVLIILGVICFGVLIFKDKNFLKFKKGDESLESNKLLTNKEKIKLSFTSPIMLIFYIQMILSCFTVLAGGLLTSLLEEFPLQ